jgi:hypothetical protein
VSQTAERFIWWLYAQVKVATDEVSPSVCALRIGIRCTSSPLTWTVTGPSQVTTQPLERFRKLEKEFASLVERS